jgi:hypothetical protein
LADSNKVENVAEANSATPANLNDSLVIVKGERSAGSGFVCTVDGRRYLISNLHVVAGNLTNTYTTVRGSKLAVSNLEVAAEADLVRMLVSSGNCRGLTISARESVIGDPVTVYGNSQGANVATRLSGTVCGVGPDLLEVTAEFVHGNSGSPILDAQNEVVGVATFALKLTPDSLSTNTFSAIRRYGVKLSSVMPGEWISILHTNAFKQYALLEDLELMGIRAYLDLGRWNGDIDKVRFKELRADAHINSAFQRDAYVDPKWFEAVEKALKEIQAADDMLREKVSKHDSRVTSAAAAFKRAMLKINKEPMQQCDKTQWIKNKIITDRVQGLRELYSPMGREIDSLWNRIQKVLK